MKSTSKWINEFSEAVERCVKAFLQLAKELVTAFKNFAKAVRRPKTPRTVLRVDNIDLDHFIETFDQDLVMRPLSGHPGTFRGCIDGRHITATFVDDEIYDLSGEKIDEIWQSVKSKIGNK